MNAKPGVAVQELRSLMGRFFKENKGFRVVGRSSVGWGGEGRRPKSLTHNLKAAGSNPAPATMHYSSEKTKEKPPRRVAFFVPKSLRRMHIGCKWE